MAPPLCRTFSRRKARIISTTIVPFTAILFSRVESSKRGRTTVPITIPRIFEPAYLRKANARAVESHEDATRQ
jgi:hypothetical protein